VNQECARGRSLWALAAVLLAMTVMVLLSSGGGAARADTAVAAQGTPTPEYPLPPTPTPTRTATPGPTASPTPAPVGSVVPIVTGTPTASGTPFADKPQPAPKGPGLMSPFPRVRTAGSYNRRRTTLKLVKVTGLPGARIAGRCTRQIRKCHTDARIPAKRTIRLKRLQRSFKPKTIIRIRVTSPTAIGKYVEIRIRRGRPPVRRDSCVRPGSLKPSACPTS
jgi:hypothetical protein